MISLACKLIPQLDSYFNLCQSGRLLFKFYHINCVSGNVIELQIALLYLERPVSSAILTF